MKGMIMAKAENALETEPAEDEKQPEREEKRRRGKRHSRHDDAEDTAAEIPPVKSLRRTTLVQAKVSSGLKKRALIRARELDMGLSEYIRFLMYCDIHGYAPRDGNGE